MAEIIYDKRSLINRLYNSEGSDVLTYRYLNVILDNIKSDQQEECDLIEIDTTINFYRSSPIDHTHVFHLSEYSKQVLDIINFSKKIYIRTNDKRLGTEGREYPESDHLIKILSYLSKERGYNRLGFTSDDDEIIISKWQEEENEVHT